MIGDARRVSSVLAAHGWIWPCLFVGSCKLGHVDVLLISDGRMATQFSGWVRVGESLSFAGMAMLV